MSEPSKGGFEGRGKPSRIEEIPVEAKLGNPRSTTDNLKSTICPGLPQQEIFVLHASSYGSRIGQDASD